MHRPPMQGRTAGDSAAMILGRHFRREVLPLVVFAHGRNQAVSRAIYAVKTSFARRSPNTFGKQRAISKAVATTVGIRIAQSEQMSCVEHSS